MSFDVQLLSMCSDQASPCGLVAMSGFADLKAVQLSGSQGPCMAQDVMCPAGQGKFKADTAWRWS